MKRRTALTPPLYRAGGRVRRHIRARPRLFVSAVVGAVAAFGMPGAPGATLRAVIGWDTGVAVFLILVFVMAARANSATMSRHAEREDEARWAFLALMAAAAFFSMFAILGMIRGARGAQGGISLALTLLGGATILLSWLFAHTVFAVHYAHDYFAERGAGAVPGLAFPGAREDPDYWDFLYFSFVVGMTCQVSDVQVVAQRWRRLVLAHGIVAFLFNTVVLALCINLIAGLL